jgi:GR25 family glycosyltransferase involved in LPS biosynthesis
MTTNGLDEIDIVYYINLDKRPDRNTQICDELKKSNINPAKINRICAHDVPECGSYGCTLSHIEAVTKFLETDNSVQTCIILEDDFQFVQDQHQITSSINMFLTDFKDKWDVLFLSLNLIYAEKTEYPYAVRVLRSYCLSGYIINKRFAPQLLTNFKESAELLKKEGHYVPTLCVDNYMGRLQKTTNWFAITPRVGLQRPSYSDIEKRYVNYQC